MTYCINRNLEECIYIKNCHHRYTQIKRRVDVELVGVILALGSPLKWGSATLVPLTVIQKILVLGGVLLFAIILALCLEPK